MVSLHSTALPLRYSLKARSGAGDLKIAQSDPLVKDILLLPIQLLLTLTFTSKGLKNDNILRYSDNFHAAWNNSF